MRERDSSGEFGQSKKKIHNKKVTQSWARKVAPSQGGGRRERGEGGGAQRRVLMDYIQNELQNGNWAAGLFVRHKALFA